MKNKETKKNKPATPKQKKLINLIVANLGNKNNTKSMKELMREVGYSESQCKNPKQILDSPVIKEGTNDFLEAMEKKRNMAITKLTEEKLDKADARAVANVLDVLTKNIQLLGNKPTEITKHQLSEKEQGEIDELLD